MSRPAVTITLTRPGRPGRKPEPAEIGLVEPNDRLQARWQEAVRAMHAGGRLTPSLSSAFGVALLGLWLPPQLGCGRPGDIDYRWVDYGDAVWDRLTAGGATDAEISAAVEAVLAYTRGTGTSTPTDDDVAREAENFEGPGEVPTSSG